MKWILLGVSIGLLTLNHQDVRNENVCRARQWRCERRCTEDHTVGSAEHLKCNERCWEDYRWCRKERP